MYKRIFISDSEGGTTVKEYLKSAAIIGLCLFLIPMIIVYASGYDTGKLLKTIEDANGEEAHGAPLDIINEETLIGILAKEIPYTYEEEAIKVQAVVTRTYMARRILGIQSKGALKGYSVEEMKAIWQDDYDKNYAIYKAAVESTYYEMIFYDNQPIEALYHSASAGKTRNAASIYNKDIPYLQSVDSKVDHISKQVRLTKGKTTELIKTKYPELIVDIGTLENQIQIIEKDEADYVKSIQVGNVTLKGEEIKELLDLPSSCFKVYSSGDELIFDVRGIGQGIGLSQNGANELAKQGMNYKDIIKYYYTDVMIEKYEIQN